MGVLAQVVMPFRTGLTKDVATNNFVIGGNDADTLGASGLATIAAEIVNFYTAAFGGGFTDSVGSRLSPCLSRVADACAVKMYPINPLLDGSPAGSPAYIDSFTLPAAEAGVGLPEEVAVCFTLEANNRAAQRVEVADGADPDARPDRPRQRYTGRFYLGPLHASWSSQTATTLEQRVDASLAGRVRDKFALIADQVETSVPGSWLGVWSRADRAIRSIDNISSDNAFDVQRRRGVAPSVRTRTAVAVGNYAELAA